MEDLLLFVNIILKVGIKMNSTFEDWMKKELREGTMNEKQDYVLECYCPDGKDGVYHVLDKDRLNKDLDQVRLRYEAAYKPHERPADYISYQQIHS